ncbi:ABC transporter permease subunit [Mycoplasma phocoeninasale]|uniref:ABC transporter permease subunit n=1 Tax=Mycoplasma phocoeninasale TaxID=2726117 RepID=UPI0019688DBF|nr:ABC transporter permease subunit [Mycoplasma phocoeninasale]MBN0970811.1 ABC transporter permease subunit [Mycoplasma phocoeninasale]
MQANNHLFQLASKKPTIKTYAVHQSQKQQFWKRFFQKKANIASIVILVIVVLASLIALFFIKNSPAKSIDSNSNFVNNLPSINQLVVHNFERGPQVDFIREIAKLEANRAFQVNESPQFQIFFDSALDSGGDITVNTDIITLVYNPYDLIKAINLNTDAKISLPYTILGTNQNGVDLYARINVSILITLTTIILAIAINIFIGFSLAAVYAFNRSKWYANLIDKVASVLGSIPELIWIFILCIFLGTQWYWILLAFVLISWISYYEIAKNEISVLIKREYISAAIVVGLNKFQIIYRHLFKAILPTMLILVVDRLAINILIISSLAFLDLITNENNLNIGTILKEALLSARSNWVYITLVSLYLTVFSISLKLFNISLATTYYPKLALKK